MQWIIQNQELAAGIIASGLLSAFVVGWWIKQKMRFQYQLLEQQAQAEQTLLQSRIEQLEAGLKESRQELEQLDIERDKAALELKETHGQLMAATENPKAL